MNNASRFLVGAGLIVISGTAAAGLVSVTLDTPATVSLMGLGVVVSVLITRFFKR